MEWILRGRAWKFGEQIPVDGAVMPLEYVRARVTDPDELAKHVMEGIDPEFPGKVRPGDIIVAGKRFGHGNAHVHGFKGIKALGLGLVCEWMPRSAYRMCVIAGVPTIGKCAGITVAVEQGDELEVDFRTGEVKVLRTGQLLKGEPMPSLLQEILEAGGSSAYIPKMLEEIEAGAARGESGERR